MPKTVSAGLLAVKQSGTTSLTVLMKIMPESGPVIGFADFGKDIDFDDGTGSLTYMARYGMFKNNIQTSANSAVDNTEFQGLIADISVSGITERDIRAGVYDGADMAIYLINRDNLADGLEWLGNGKIGVIGIENDALRVEFLSLNQLLKQTIGILTSKTCRYEFGAPTSGDIANCNFDIAGAGIIKLGSVTTVNEVRYSFTDSVLTDPDGFFFPGLVTFTSGDNLGISREIKSYVSKQVTVYYSFPYAIQIGDSFNIRPDCDKDFNGAKGCKFYLNQDDFGGEPFIPTEEGPKLMTPGASS